MKKVLTFTIVIMILSMTCVPFYSYSNTTMDAYSVIFDSNVDLSYKQEIMPHFYPELFEGRENLWFYYDMEYAHPQKDSQGNPQYIVFIGVTGIGGEAFAKKYIGDCLVVNNTLDYPYDLGHYVYVPEKQKVYTLEEAYYSEELDISDAMRSGCVGLHRGDINYDRRCDVLDATIIQRYLAGFSINSDINISRMNLDGSKDINIIDATKLQRYIAKMDDTFTDVAVVVP